MRRAVHREQRIETGIDKSKVDKQRKVDKLMFFKQFLNEGGLVLSVIELHNAIKSYINRYANEILELKNQIRPNRPKPSRIEKLELVKSGDESEYKTGFGILKHTSFYDDTLIDTF